MLSEEEKKAIEFIKFYQQHCLKKEKENMKQYETVNDEEFVSKNLDTVLNLITKLQKENEYWKNKFEEELEDNRKNTCELLKQDLIIREKDNKVKKIVKRLDNDILRISKSKEINRWDDYRRCRLKAYRTKTREIKEYIEQEYFEKLAKEKGE